MVIIFLLLFALLTPLSAHALTTPTFPACANPQGIVKVEYSEGAHGIAGDTNPHTGTDSVYTLNADTLTQCFCSIYGNGIQTNWWKVSSLTDEEVDILKKEDWIFIPDGALWGLEAAPYLAKNNPYGCEPQESVQGASTNNSSNNQSDPSQNSSSQTSSGDVLGATTNAAGSVLGATGNASLFYLSGIMGIFFLSTGLWLKVKR